MLRTRRIGQTLLRPRPVEVVSTNLPPKANLNQFLGNPPAVTSRMRWPLRAWNKASDSSHAGAPVNSAARIRQVSTRPAGVMGDGVKSSVRSDNLPVTPPTFSESPTSNCPSSATQPNPLDCCRGESAGHGAGFVTVSIRESNKSKLPG